MRIECIESVECVEPLERVPCEGRMSPERGHRAWGPGSSGPVPDGRGTPL